MDPVYVDGSAIPVVMSLIEGVKRIIPEKWRDKMLPLLCTLMGITYATLLSPDQLPVLQEVLKGVMIGMACSGTFITARRSSPAVANVVRKVFGKAPKKKK